MNLLECKWRDFEDCSAILSDSTSRCVAPWLLQQISSLQLAESNDGSTKQLNIEQERKPAQSGLIEVISSTESDQSQPQQPTHHLRACPDGGGSSRSLQLSVELPGVRSVSQCRLSISQVSITSTSTVWGEVWITKLLPFLFYFINWYTQFWFNVCTDLILYIFLEGFIHVVNSKRGWFLLFRMIFSWK